MQRSIERAESADYGGSQIGLGGDNDPGGKGGRVQSMVNDRVQISFHRTHLFRTRHFAGQDKQISSRVSQIRAGSDRLALIEHPRIRSDDVGKLATNFTAA